MTRRTYTPTHLRAWREYRNMSLQDAVDLLSELAGESLTRTSLSRIEIGKQPYSQPILEGLAVVYGTTPAALLAHNPLGSSGVTSFWDHKLSAEQAQTPTQAAAPISAAKKSKKPRRKNAP